MGDGRTWALALAMLLAATACMGDAGETREDARVTSSQSDERPLAAYGDAERTWLAALGTWRDAIDVALWEFTIASNDERILASIGRGDDDAEGYVRALLEDLRSCSETFREDVGDSPTPRLAPGAEAVVTACEYLERGAEEDLADLGGGDEDPFRDGGFWIGDGRERLWTSNRQILLRADGRRLIPKGVPGESHVDVSLSDAANQLVDLLRVQLQVRCWSEDDWPEIVEELGAFTNGQVTTETMAWASHSIGVHVSPAACTKLGDIAAGDVIVDEASARPLVAFARELGRLLGYRVEAFAECWAMQAADDVARAIGASPTDARALGRLYWERVFPELPSELRSSECRPGGQFDFDPGKAWP